MKYSLAFDRGSFRDINERYVKVPSSLINKDLDTNNNLKKLCYFTSCFNSSQDLKTFIISLDPKFSVYKNYNLVIVWNRKYKGVNYIRSEDIPYKKDYIYFNFECIVKMIFNIAYDPLFKSFYDFFKKQQYSLKELDDICSAMINCKPDYIVEDAIRAFLNKNLMGPKGLSFSNLYKMVMFLLRLTNTNKKEINKEENNLEVKEDYSPLSEEQQFEAEWLIRRARLRKLNEGFYNL